MTKHYQWNTGEWLTDEELERVNGFRLIAIPVVIAFMLIITIWGTWGMR